MAPTLDRGPPGRGARADGDSRGWPGLAYARRVSRPNVAAPEVLERTPIFQRLTGMLGARRMLRAIALYPPYLGAGIRVVEVDDALRRIVVEMPLRRWNQNYLGTHFGGSLYSMCDPFHVIMLLENLGPGHVVWDKEATIAFLRPGRGRVQARFELADRDLASLRAELERHGKAYPTFDIDVVDEAGRQVARVSKTLSIRTRQTS